MHFLKQWFEKPLAVWALIAAAYIALFAAKFAHLPVEGHEADVHQILTEFSESSFPPRIELVRSIPDWGHLGYYGAVGRLGHWLGTPPERMRAVNLVFMLLAFFVFTSLTKYYCRAHRLNPFWESFALIIFAANPYAFEAAARMGYHAMLLLLLLFALLSFEKEDFRWSPWSLSLAVLVDWRAIILAIAFLIVRTFSMQSRLLRPERAIALIMPFAAGALPLIAWHSIVPYGEARDWFHEVRERSGFVHPDGFFYACALLPIYTLVYSWGLGTRARVLALKRGAIVTLILAPLYFLFPVHFEEWSLLKNSAVAPLGLVDAGFTRVAGEYKNMLLFIPWICGTFFFLQFCLRDISDQSRTLWWTVLMLFLTQPFLGGIGGLVGDLDFLFVIPFVLLFSLSEVLVGDEGKLV